MKFRFTRQKVQRALVLENSLCLMPFISNVIQTAISGVEIDWIRSEVEAYSRLKEYQYTVIIADTIGMDFWQYCQKHHPETPFLLTSTISIDMLIRKLGYYEIPHYLEKPFNAMQFQMVIRNLVSHCGLAS